MTQRGLLARLLAWIAEVETIAEKNEKTSGHDRVAKY
jgi:hypothetical protein